MWQPQTQPYHCKPKKASIDVLEASSGLAAPQFGMPSAIVLGLRWPFLFTLLGITEETTIVSLSLDETECWLKHCLDIPKTLVACLTEVAAMGLLEADRKIK
jgi:hypothetical protein